MRGHIDDIQRIRMAPQEPVEEQTVTWGSYSIQCRHPDAPNLLTGKTMTDRWFTVWAGERHRRDGDPSAYEEANIEAHRKLDHLYISGGVKDFAEVRMLLSIKKTTSSVVVVPAMWEEGT
jgi:hypothetical protein